MPPPQPLRRRTLAFYAFPAFALAMPTIPLYVFLPAFYADELGLGLAATGAALLWARVFDVVTDPLIGILSDRTRSRWGRRKPWIAAGAIIAALGLIRLMDPAEGSVSFLYLLGWSAILYFGWTLVAIPYNAWGAELSADYHERSMITGAREATTVLGVLAAGLAPFVALQMGGTEADGIAAVAWLAVAVGGPAIVLLLWAIADRNTAAPAAAPREGLSWQRARELFRNRPFARLVSAWFVNGFANGLPSVLFVLYLEYGLQVDKATSNLLIMAYFLAGIIAIPLWVWLSRRIGKHRAWCWAMILACVSFVWVPMLQPGDVVPFLIICLLTGMAFGADLALPPAMQADVVDYDTLRSGRERAGLFFALWSMSTKLATAGAVGVAFPLLAAFGFKPAAGNEAGALLALAVIYALVPTVLKICAICLMWTHPITLRRQQTIRRRLDKLADRNVHRDFT